MKGEYARKNLTEMEETSASQDKGLDKFSGKRLNLKYKRPPKTSAEAMQTLQEVDARFEVMKQHLVGKKGKLAD